MNETQAEYVASIRRGHKTCAHVCEDFRDLDTAAYKNAGFREMLFAIDAMNRFHGGEWQDVFIRRLIDHSDWIENRRLLPRAYTEIGDCHERYGYGVYGVSLVVDLYEEAERKPVNSTSFTRRTIREFFNGVQPLEERTLFLVKRFFSLQKPLVDEDVRLLFHIREETKGLANVDTFDHFFSSTLRDWIVAGPEDVKGQRERLVFWLMGCADEITHAEKMLIRMIKDRGEAVPVELLAHIDLSRDKLMGLS